MEKVEVMQTKGGEKIEKRRDPTAHNWSAAYRKSCNNHPKKRVPTALAVALLQVP